MTECYCRLCGGSYQSSHQVAIVLYITLPVSKLDPATPCPVPHPLLNFISGISLLVFFSFSGLTCAALTSPVHPFFSHKHDDVYRSRIRQIYTSRRSSTQQNTKYGDDGGRSNDFQQSTDTDHHLCAALSSAIPVWSEEGISEPLWWSGSFCSGIHTHYV